MFLYLHQPIQLSRNQLAGYLTLALIGGLFAKSIPIILQSFDLGLEQQRLLFIEMIADIVVYSLFYFMFIFVPLYIFFNILRILNQFHLLSVIMTCSMTGFGFILLFESFQHTAKIPSTLDAGVVYFGFGIILSFIYLCFKHLDKQVPSKRPRSR